jgi:SAM-dependent methyltransferase
MDSKTSAALAELNRAFYTRFAGDFARTRRAWPPGFDLILPHICRAANILDLGCGNGRLLAFLAERGWRGRYVGVDGSAELLAIAAENASQHAGVASLFLPLDLLGAGWPEDVRRSLRAPDDAEPGRLAVTALAVLHHIPGADARAGFLANCRSLLAPGAVLVVSTWQFLGSSRLRARILPWSLAGLTERDVEPGDYLLSWGEGAAGQRYCAYIDQGQLSRLAEQAGLALHESFYADGQEGNFNLYGILRRPD